MEDFDPDFFNVRISTERCILRPWSEDDVLGLAAIANTRDISWNTSYRFSYPFEEAEALKLIRFTMQGAGLDKWQFAVECEGKLVGGCGALRGTDVQAHTAEVGYWLGTDFWGKGFATEMVKALVSYMAEHTDIEQLTATCYGWNPASMKVLDKVGFVREGLRKGVVRKWGKTTDLAIYGKLLSDT